MVGCGCGAVGCLCPFATLLWCNHQVAIADVRLDEGDVCDVVSGGGHIFVVRFVFYVVSLLLYFFV